MLVKPQPLMKERIFGEVRKSGGCGKGGKPTIGCYYCDLMAACDSRYGGRAARYDLGSQAPRCARHWRYVCGACERTAHFMAVAFCPSAVRFFCSDCATATEVVEEQFYAWDYYFRYRSPWSNEWEPSLDRLEFDGRHPHQTDSSWGRRGWGCGNERFYPRYRATRPQMPVGDVIDDLAIRAAWNQNAESWNAALGDAGDETRRYQSDQPMLALLGHVTDLEILDIGCGNGYLCRRLARLGGRVTGVDLSDRLIALAQSFEAQRQIGVKYLVGSATDLSMLGDASFDRILFNYVLMSIPDYTNALIEANRLLSTDGRVLIVITHPCFSYGPGRWEPYIPDSPRREEASIFCINDYLRPASYVMDEWEGFHPIPYVHRPLAAYWHGFKAAGFKVLDFEEPGLSDRGRAELPDWKVRQFDRIPVACIFHLAKN